MVKLVLLLLATVPLLGATGISVELVDDNNTQDLIGEVLISSISLQYVLVFVYLFLHYSDPCYIVVYYCG